METYTIVAYSFLGLTIILTNVYVWYNYGKDSLITSVILTTLLIVVYLIINQLNPDYVADNWALLSCSLVILWVVYYAYNNPADALVIWNNILENYVYIGSSGGDDTSGQIDMNLPSSEEGGMGMSKENGSDSNMIDTTSDNNENDFIRTGINNIRNTSQPEGLPNMNLPQAPGLNFNPTPQTQPNVIQPTPQNVNPPTPATPGFIPSTPGFLPSTPRTPGGGTQRFTQMTQGPPGTPGTPGGGGVQSNLNPGMAFNMPSTPIRTPTRVAFTPSTKQQ